LDVQPPMVISLAKKEEIIYVHGREEPLRLSRHDPALRLCQAIRDEAHRFAQLYHHLLRKKSLLEDKLPPRRGKKQKGMPEVDAAAGRGIPLIHPDEPELTDEELQ